MKRRYGYTDFKLDNIMGIHAYNEKTEEGFFVEIPSKPAAVYGIVVLPD